MNLEHDETDKDDDSLFIGKYSTNQECIENIATSVDYCEDIEEKVVPSIFGNAMKNYRDLINWKYNAPTSTDSVSGYGVESHTHTTNAT